MYLTGRGWLRYLGSAAAAVQTSVPPCTDPREPGGCPWEDHEHDVRMGAVV